jgi:DNA-binding NtrC family response regulator
MADVLVVDDDVDLARTIGDVIEAMGHHVRLAFNGSDGLTAIATKRPDVMLLDVEMPVLDGPSMAYELLVRDAGLELIPIVLASGYAGIEVVAERIGTPYYVMKPCSLKTLASIVERACRERIPPHHGRPRPVKEAQA